MKDAIEFLNTLNLEQPMPNGPKRQKNFNLPADLVQALEDVAKESGVSDSEIGRVWLTNGMKLYLAGNPTAPKAPGGRPRPSAAEKGETNYVALPAMA